MNRGNRVFGLPAPLAPTSSTCDNRAHTLEIAAKVFHLSGQEGAPPLFGEAFFSYPGMNSGSGIRIVGTGSGWSDRVDIHVTN
ncbi:MAG: hypothetical protein APR55_11090 [Methanolinea sp. SDB]|nr:MAG: hypothetical protein APR55_11090 [Methanolinea sp. SDB]